ncbi:MAG TPA: PP2C family protein-serine/threonine phosphatase [Acidobacteriaceae bacterium]|jgi:hypothetical protein|nr:PP2C family protein-serine/threonine phosphatase [Acidobacteriaceae bacterium]
MPPRPTDPFLRTLGRVVLLLLVVCAADQSRASAQTALSIHPTTCVWRQGDDSQWAAPGLDESAWLPVSQWPAGATPTPDFWLRCRFQTGDLAVAVTPTLQISGDLAYQVFVEGRPIGSFGNLATGQHTIGAVRDYTSPAFAPSHRPVLVALRMMYTPVLDGVQVLPKLTLGDAQLQRGNYLAQVVASVRSQWLTWTCYTLITAAGLFFFALYWFDRSQRYLLIIGIVWLALADLRINEFLYTASIPYPSRLNFFLYAIGQVGSILILQFFFTLNHRRVPWIYRAVQTINGLQAVALLIAVFLPLHWAMALRYHAEMANWADFTLITAMLIGCSAPFIAFRPLTRLRGVQIPLAIVCCLWALTDAAYYTVQLPLFTEPVTVWFNRIQPWRSLAIAAVVVALTLLLVQRLRATNRERAELEGEMQAARHIQQLLVPETLDVAPGLSIESVFLPAQEVGGDFFRCRVLPNGAQRILLGDVSGKGAAAAMTSAVLLGAAERHDTDSPAQLLTHLNRVLIASGIGGFATCLCADLAPSGAVILANAGHLPPWCRGEEVTSSASLPLGLSSAEHYPETPLNLAPGDALTFLSDGVVEARNTTGELFGFERTQAIIGQSPRQIAHTAQAFGQNDDITILSVTRQPVAASTTQIAPAPASLG